MNRKLAVLASIVVLVSGLSTGCATLQQIAALRSVAFAFGRVTDVKCAGVSIGPETKFSSLGLTDLAKVSAAIARKEMPLELVAHVSATNPPDNRVAARVVELGWKFFVEDAQVLTGRVGEPVVIEPGATADVPVAVRMDLMKIRGGTARDLFDAALAIAGHGTPKQELRLELTPTIDTAIGPITYPNPVVIRRAGTAN